MRSPISSWPRRILYPALLCLLSAIPGRAADRQVLHGHVPEVLSRLEPIGRLEPARRISLAIGLPLRNRAALDALNGRLYDPASPDYRHYLTPRQFTEQFGPTQQDFDAVASFAAAHGLTVTYRHRNRLVVDVTGAVSDIEKTLHVTMRTYRHPTEARTFYAPDVEPSLDLTVPISHISGLDNYELPKPSFKRIPAAAAPGVAKPETGSGPSGTYMGYDFRSAYAPGVALTGSGQTIGLLEFDGYQSSDITYYETAAGLPAVTTSNVILDNATGNPYSNDGQTEVSLDIEVAIAMAPGASQVVVYEAGPSGNFDDILNRMASDDSAAQLSSSWSSSGQGDDPTADNAFTEMAAQGQSFFQASGDSDAYTGSIPFPCDNPYLTSVGGTTLTDGGTGGPWSSETVWNWGYVSGDRAYIGSSGGISTHYSIPTWQKGISMSSNLGSTTRRNVPDVALTADNVSVRVAGANEDVGGTSCAAPLWAGFIALVNQQALANGRNAVGFINPAIYTIAAGSNYSTDFHDIATGNNFTGSSSPKFSAVAGYDLCTGLGTPAGAALINALAQPPEGLGVSSSTFAASGPVGGPFASATNTYTLTNSGAASLPWTAGASLGWLSLSATSGSLAASGTATVTASINANAQALASGTYSASIIFTDTGTGYSLTRPVTLTVFPAPAITSALKATATNGVAFSYQITASNSPTAFAASGLPAGFTVSSTTGLISGSTTATGSSNVTISAINASGTGSATLVLTVLPAPPVITGTLAATATNGAAFYYKINATNNPSSFGASGLPSGLTVNTATGVISGTTTATGSSNVTISASNAGGTGSALLALTVLPPPPVITSVLTATATNGAAFSYLIAATNAPASFAATTLPAGLTVNTATGLISGSTTATGSSNVTISAINSGGTGSAILALTVLPPPPVITSTTSAIAYIGLPFTYQIAATNGPGSYYANGLPAGLTVSSTSGIISGTAASAGVTNVTIGAINTGGTGSATLSISVLAAPPVITSALTATGTVGAAFSYQITASGSPTDFGATGLPASLALSSGGIFNVSPGLISGILANTGTTSVVISAVNSSGTGSAILVITALPAGPPVITSTTSATVTEGQPFTYQITATNNPGSFGAAGLPAGFTVSAAGLISGTWTAPGTNNLSISASNAVGTGTAALSVLVQSPYSAWQSQVFPPTALIASNVSGDTADPAGDGIPNLLKYALNLNPFINGVSGLPVQSIAVTGSGNYLALTYTQVISATDVTYTVQVSNDLQTWNSGVGYTNPPSATNNADGLTQTVTVQSAIPIGSATGQYIRLQITGP